MKPYTILQVEDNEGDVLLIQEAFQMVNKDVTLVHVHNGREAIEYLNNCASIPSYKIPDLILLDINMPKMNGHQVLNYCKSSEFKRIPIIVLSTSTAPADVLLSYKNYANCYISKPIDLVEYIETIKAIDDYWLHNAQLPSFKA